MAGAGVTYRGGIRTRETPAGLLRYQRSAFDRSATRPHQWRNRRYGECGPPFQTPARPQDIHSPAASLSISLNQACAGSLAVRRCQAIEMVAEKSTGRGRVASSAWAATRAAARLGRVATRSEAASAAGTAR